MILHDHFAERLVIERLSLAENILFHVIHLHKSSQLSHVFRDINDYLAAFVLDILTTLTLIAFVLILVQRSCRRLIAGTLNFAKLRGAIIGQHLLLQVIKA